MKCAYKQKLLTFSSTDPTPWAEELLCEENYDFQGVKSLSF